MVWAWTVHVSPVQFSSRWHLGAQESPCRRIPPHLLEDSPVVPLKQFQCWFDWRQPFRIILTPSMSSWERVDVYVCACLSWREWERERVGVYVWACLRVAACKPSVIFVPYSFGWWGWGSRRGALILVLRKWVGQVGDVTCTVEP